MPGRSRARSVAVLVGLAAMLGGLAAACSNSSSSTSSSTPAAAAIKVGFFGALTGPNSPQLGINIRQGMDLAINQHNQKGGVQVQLVPYDSQGDPAQAPQLAQKAVSDKVLAIVGPAFSGESKVADPILEEAQIPHLTPSATNVALAANGWRFFYRALANDAAQAPADATWIESKVKAKTVAVIDDASDYGKGLADGVRTKFKADKVLVAVSEEIDPKSQDYSSTVNKINAAHVDAVFYGGYYQDAGRLLKQLRDAGVKSPFVSGDGSNDQKLVTTAGAAAAEGAVTTCACSTSSSGAAGQAFTTAYKAAYSADPGTYSAEAFDVMNLILAGIDAGKTTPAALNDYIKTSPYVGITKTLKFDPNGEVQGGQIFVYQVKGGTLTELGPVTSAVGA